MVAIAAASDEAEYLRLLEEQYRDRARNSLDDYCRYVEIPGAPMVEDSCPLGDACDDPECRKHEVSAAFYPDTVEPAEHHSLLNSKLEKLATGEIPRMMVMMPPGSAKSTYGSVTFPTWFMGKFPRKNIICTSYATALARKFGRKCRSITGSKRFTELFNTGLNNSNRSAHDWSLTNLSTYMAGGILSGITGNRADGLVIDDPVQGRDQAESPVISDKTWEAYLSDLRTRLKPNAWQLIIQTRWHEDDLSGRILPKEWDGESGWVTSQQGESWYVLCLQAQCEHENDPLGREIGEWLWTDWFTPEHWATEKQVQGSRNWEALYQQRPKPAEGALIQRAWPKRYDTPPAEFLRVVQSWDTAYKDKDINDPSVCTTWGETRHGWYLLDVFRQRMQYPDLKRMVASLYKKWQPSAVLIEDKASGQSLIQELRADTRVPVVAIEPAGSKLDRLIAVSPRFEAGQVYFPNYAPWLPDFESEIFGYPLVTHDDQVDSVSQFISWAHSFAAKIGAVLSGNTRAGNAMDKANGGGGQIDEDNGWGTISGNNEFGGFI